MLRLSNQWGPPPTFKEKKEIIGVNNLTNSTSSYTGWEVILDKKKEERFNVYLLYYPTTILSCFYDESDWSDDYELSNKKIPILAELYWADYHWHLDSFEIEEYHYLSSSVEEQIAIIKEFVSRSIARYNQE